jgi:hypothetical protein
MEARSTIMAIITPQLQSKQAKNSLNQQKWLEVQSISNPRPSICRLCQFYRSQGRNDGYCQKLGVCVSSHWKSCNFALPPFAPSWERNLQ